MIFNLEYYTQLNYQSRVKAEIKIFSDTQCLKNLLPMKPFSGNHLKNVLVTKWGKLRKNKTWNLRYRGEAEGKWREFQDKSARKSQENSYSAKSKLEGRQCSSKYWKLTWCVWLRLSVFLKFCFTSWRWTSVDYL